MWRAFRVGGAVLWVARSETNGLRRWRLERNVLHFAAGMRCRRTHVHRSPIHIDHGSIAIREYAYLLFQSDSLVELRYVHLLPWRHDLCR